MIKCRDCQFKTNDLLEIHRHAEENDHHDFSILSGGKVVLDWIHIETEIIRESSE